MSQEKADQTQRKLTIGSRRIKEEERLILITSLESPILPTQCSTHLLPGKGINSRLQTHGRIMEMLQVGGSYLRVHRMT